LEDEFTAADLFMDVEGSIKPGDDFVAVLNAQVVTCDVLLAVIGPRWSELLAARANGPDDFVSIEIMAALENNKLIIPVLVGGADMPLACTLPEAIRPLAHRNAVALRPERFRVDCQGLINALKEQFAATAAERGTAEAAHSEEFEETKGLKSWFKYLDKFPKGWYAAEAQARIDALEKPQEPQSVRVTLGPFIILCFIGVAAFFAVTTSWPTRHALTGATPAPPPDVFKDCYKCPEMIVVPSGSFTMGSPSNEPEREHRETQVPVTIAQAFAVGRYAVTFDEWDTCVADGCCGGYKPSDQGWGRGRRPVINVSWDDAQKYVAWISGKTGNTYRLLSESERGYVTRAGATTPFWWGTSITPRQANYDGRADPYKGGGSKGQYRGQTVPVDSFDPNPWGLYNVHGNVWEWTDDCWNETNNGNPGDGSARMTGDCTLRVRRGGSYVNVPWALRAAERDSAFASSKTFLFDPYGFRVARTLTP
jgi:formylglycine-generating enzyme required for sulfatase activity